MVSFHIAHGMCGVLHVERRKMSSVCEATERSSYEADINVYLIKRVYLMTEANVTGPAFWFVERSCVSKCILS